MELMIIFVSGFWVFWSGNFIVGKFATLYEVPPLTLNFFRWLIVWFILIPFTLTYFRILTIQICVIVGLFTGGCRQPTQLLLAKLC